MRPQCCSIASKEHYKEEAQYQQEARCTAEQFVYLAHGLWVCGACGEVAVQVQAPIQAAPAVVACSRVGQAGRHQWDTLWTGAAADNQPVSSSPVMHLGG